MLDSLSLSLSLALLRSARESFEPLVLPDSLSRLTAVSVWFLELLSDKTLETIRSLKEGLTAKKIENENEVKSVRILR